MEGSGWAPGLGALGASRLTLGGTCVSAAGPVMGLGDWFPNPAVAEDHRLSLSIPSFEISGSAGPEHAASELLMQAGTSRGRGRLPCREAAPARDSFAHAFLGNFQFQKNSEPPPDII